MVVQRPSCNTCFIPINRLIVMHSTTVVDFDSCLTLKVCHERMIVPVNLVHITETTPASRKFCYLFLARYCSRAHTLFVSSLSLSLLLPLPHQGICMKRSYPQTRIHRRCTRSRWKRSRKCTTNEARRARLPHQRAGRPPLFSLWRYADSSCLPLAHVRFHAHSHVLKTHPCKLGCMQFV